MPGQNAENSKLLKIIIREGGSILYLRMAKEILIAMVMYMYIHVLAG